MAKAYFNCDSCGASVAIFGHNRREADRKAEWAEGEGLLCQECKEKERQAGNKDAAAANMAASLPELTGSEKQVAWAETIRRRKIDQLMAGVYGCYTVTDMWAWWVSTSLYDRGFQIGPDHEHIEYLVEVMRGQNSASWWIDNRDAKIGRILYDLFEEHPPRPEQSDEEKALEAEAMAEALLVPAGELKSGTPAEISIIDSTVVTIHYPIKDRDLWEIVKPGMGFRWSDNRWVLKTAPWTGSAVDRAAEAAHRLLAAGFKVIVWDEEARALAVSGDFSPRHYRWVVRVADTDRFAVNWGGNDDFYREARKITGSRYNRDSKRVEVPAAEYREVLDFAEVNDFRLSPGAEELIDRWQAMETGATVVAAEVAEPEPAAPAKRPDLDPDDIDGEIDDDLRDN